MRVSGLAVLGTLLVAILCSLFILYLGIPPGWSPSIGFAPLIGPVYQARFHLPTFTLSPTAFVRLAVAAILGAWAIYGVALAWVARLSDEGDRRRALIVVVSVAVVAHLALVFMPPVLSMDLYLYALFGRMVTVYGLDPYRTAASALAADSLARFADWQHLRSQYGPTFTWISAVATGLGGSGPIGNALAFKGVAAAFNLLSCWAVWRTASLLAPGTALTALAVYAWNPLVLVESAGSGHADSVMIALALVGIYLCLRARDDRDLLAAFTLLVASVATKYLTGVPALLLATNRVWSATTARQRLWRATCIAAVTIVTGAVLFGPFWHGGQVLRPVLDFVVKGRAIGLGHPDAPHTSTAALMLFAGLLLGSAILAVRIPPGWLAGLSAALITFFLMFVIRWPMPWYYTCGIALTVAGPPTLLHRVLRMVLLFMGLFVMLLYASLLRIPGL